MRRIEHELSTAHDPKNGNCGSLRWGYNSHNGRRLDSSTRSRARGKTEPKVIRRMVQAPLIRRVGLVGRGKIKPEEVAGFIQALRTADIDAKGGNIEESRDHIAGGGDQDSQLPESPRRFEFRHG